MKVWVATRFEDADGVHEVGDEVEIPRNTEEQKEAFDRLVEYQIIATTEKRAQEIASGNPPQPRR